MSDDRPSGSPDPADAEQLLITAAVAEDIPGRIGGRRIGVDVVDDDAGRRSHIVDGALDDVTAAGEEAHE